MPDSGVKTGPPTITVARNVGHPPTRGKPAGGRRRRKRSGVSSAWRRRIRIGTLVLTPVLILFGLGVLITYTRLLQGPISLERFAGPIERSISGSLGALTAKVDDVALVLTEDYGFEFRLLNLALSDSTGAQVAAAPVAAVSLSPGALITGSIVPTRVYLIDPNLLVSYRKSSGFSLQVASQLESEPALINEGRLSPRAVETLKNNQGAEAPSTASRVATPAGRVSRINIARLVSDLNARATKGMGDNSQLKEIGIRNATVTLDYDGQRSDWLIAEAAVDLDVGRRANTISGAARVQSEQGPWVFSFRTVESEREDVVRLTVSARDLVPSSIARAAPALGLLKTLEMPIGLDATMQVTDGGDMEAATLAIELTPGNLHLPSISGTPLKLEQCIFNLSYDGYQKQMTMSPSTLRWSDSFVTLQGRAQPISADNPNDDNWQFAFRAVEGQLAAEEFGVAGVKVDEWQTEGRVSLDDGKLALDKLALRTAGVAISATGELQASQDQTSTRLDAQLSSENLKLLTALWPKALAPDTRAWFGKHVQRGHIEAGTFKVVSGGFMADEAPVGPSNQQRVSLALELRDLAVTHDWGSTPAVAERALLRLENNVLEINVPEVSASMDDEETLSLKTVRLNAVNLFQTSPRAELAFKVRAPVKSAVALAAKQRPDLFQDADFMNAGIRGLIVGDFALQIPVGDSAGQKLTITSGKAEIKDLRFDKKIDNLAIRGGAFNIDVSDRLLEATGDILVNGVGFKAKMQHIVGGEWDKQPPILVSTSLDNSDRDQLGIDVNDIVAGDVPVDVSIGLQSQGPPKIHVAADLSGADLLFTEVAWRKPSGRRMKMEFDVVDGEGDRTELQNIQVVGQGIAIEGWAAIGTDNGMQEFFFPDFSIDTVTRLRLQGKLSNDRIWDVEAVGPTYDGRKFFSSLFSLGDLSDERPKARKPAKGVDVRARIENVVGGNGTSLKEFQINVSHRAGKLTALDGRATLDSNKSVVVLLKRNNGKRTLYAESDDAGRVFKLIDFYPNMVGGRGRLELDLDGQGAASQTGILWTENFRILGDEVASEVFAGAAGTKVKRRQVQRQVFDFSHLRMPFSVGHDQFVIQKSYLRGPVLGASVSGKVDYRLRRVNLGGSYIPLQGLNSALCGIPLLGEIITGPKCEGVLGITFAVQGSMSSPQVIVNPLSLVAPGIFRDIFQLTYPSTRVTPRQEGRPDIPAEQRVRASSSSSKSGTGARSGGSVNNAPVDGWSSRTQSAP